MTARFFTRIKFHFVLMVLACLGWAPGGRQALAGTLYVRTNGNDGLSGTTWAEAKQTLAGAITSAASGDEIWVARGTYAGHVTLKPGLVLYGGFAGGETLLSERNWSTNLSALWGTTNRAVVTITNAGPDTRLDGFTIGGGNGLHGGGIALIGSGPIVANNVVRNNMTDGAGAGISIWGFRKLGTALADFPVLTNNIVAYNQSINTEGDGGGIAVVGSSPLIAWNTIVRNTATRNGGGIACWRHSFPVIANNFIICNSAAYDENTASSGGGGIFASATDLDGRPIPFAVSAPTIVNNVIAANGGRHGGGVTVVDSLLGAATLLNNTIVANNGAGIYWGNTWPTNLNNVIAFNCRGFERSFVGTSDADIRFNNVFGNAVLGRPSDYLGTSDRTGILGNISADPLFANRDIGDYHLQPASPCLNAGSLAGTDAGPVDLDYQPRIQGGAIDMGADESDGTAWTVPTPVVRVSPAGDDSDGKTWATAKRTVAGGLAAAAATGGEVWVAKGSYPEHILPPAFVYLYGGFAGNETERAERDPSANASILDGGGVPPIVYFRNGGYAVSALDGFTLQNGGIHTGGDVFHPDLANRIGGRGGAIYCRVSGPQIAGNLVRSNSLGSPFGSLDSLGAGLYCYLSSATIRSNTFCDNEVLKRGDGNGGGIYCHESDASIEFNVFRRNRAVEGSAVFGALSDLRLTGNLVQSNAWYNHVPSIYMGSGSGALAFWLCPSLSIEANTIQGNVAAVGAGLRLDSCYSAQILNNLVLSNRAWDYSGFGQGGMGGGIYALVNLNSTNVSLVNNTIAGNDAPATFTDEMGGGVALTLITNSPVFANNIVVSNSSGIWRDWRTTVQPVLLNNCLMNQGGKNYLNLPQGPADLLADPRFANAPAGDYRLMAGSPCIDTGASSSAPPRDADAVQRPLDGNGDGNAAPDIGAFEFIHPTADTDSDHASDLQEIVAGTDPTDPGSTLRLTIRHVQGSNIVTLSWLSVRGRSYSLYQSPTPADPSTWSLAAGNLPGTGQPLEQEETLNLTQPRFYRLVVARSP